MPSISFEPVGLQSTVTFSLDGEAPEGMFGSQGIGIGWVIRPEPSDTIRLATGGELKDLEGRVHIRLGDAGDVGRKTYGDGTARWGALYYHESGDEWPESYTVELNVSRGLFDRIAHLVEMGRPPTIDLSVGDTRLGFGGEKRPDEGIKYGWEPDGSGKEWDNKNHSAVEIKWCSFRAKLGVPILDGDESAEAPDAALLPPTRGDLIHIRTGIEALHGGIQKLAAAIQLPLWIIGILLLIQVLRH